MNNECSYRRQNQDMEEFYEERQQTSDKTSETEHITMADD
jgi:hypothetical protein